MKNYSFLPPPPLSSTYPPSPSIYICSYTLHIIQQKWAIKEGKLDIIFKCNTNCYEKISYPLFFPPVSRDSGWFSLSIHFLEKRYSQNIFPIFTSAQKIPLDILSKKKKKRCIKKCKLYKSSLVAAMFLLQLPFTRQRCIQLPSLSPYLSEFQRIIVMGKDSKKKRKKDYK